MKIVKILGGLGNQMFQFALYMALRKRFPEERVLLDLHCFKGYGKHRGFELPKVFPIDYEEATLWEIARLAYPYPNYQAWRIGSRILPIRKTMLQELADFTIASDALTRSGDTYYDGYWQHEEYFADIREALLDAFAFPAFEDPRNQMLAQRIETSNSCAIHIRRGDYLTDPLRKGTIGNGYTERAIERMMETAQPDVWCVFSDDMEWVRERLAKQLPTNQTYYVDWNKNEKSVHDMQLMSLCRHNIIANSSFSWWGAWLSQRQAKTVIGPVHWMNLDHVCSPVPSHWLKI